MKKQIKSIVVVFFIAPFILFSQVTVKNVTIPKGKSSTTISGACKGYQTIENVLSLSADQSFSISMKANINGCYMNVIAPNGDFLFSGIQEEKRDCVVKTSEAGKYKIQVYNIRSVARRGTTASYTLTITIL